MIQHIPLPFFILDKKLQIISCSDNAKQQFPETNSFFHLVDIESKEKVYNFFFPYQTESAVLESNLITIHEPITLYKINYNYAVTEQLYYVICTPLTSQYTDVKTQLNQLRQQLLITNKHENISTMNVTNVENNQSSPSHLTANLEILKLTKKVKQNTTTIMDLLSIIYPILIENDRGEYIEMIYNEIYELQTKMDKIKRQAE